MGSHKTVGTTETGDTKGGLEIQLGKISRVVLLAIPVIVIAVLAVFNTQKVTVDWVIDDAQTNLWIIIALSALIGFASGYIAHWRRS